ncbi:MAG: glycosyltransferase family 4 protein [Telluria sp.]
MKSEEIRIGFCENGEGYGGAVISLAAFLEKIPSEFKPHIFTGIGTGKYRQLDRFGRWTHIQPVSLIDQAWLRRRRTPFASTLDNIFNLLPFALRHYRAFKRHGINLVYLNNDASCNMAAAVAGWIAGVPMVLHARGFNSDTRGNRWVLSRLDHCIAVSEAVKSELVTLGLPSSKCTVVPEGLDLNLFHPRPPSSRVYAELGLSGTEPVITLVGGLIDWKGQDVLLDAVPAILEKFPDANILLIGSAHGKDDEFGNMIVERAASQEMRGRVKVLGARTDIPDILSISSIVLHTSTQPEPFGRTFLEGMAMGKPVIASGEGGPLDVITHEVNGLLIEPRNPAKLAEAIIYLLNDPERCRAMGEKAAETARAYSIENHSDAISAILHAILSKAKRGST